MSGDRRIAASLADSRTGYRLTLIACSAIFLPATGWFVAVLATRPDSTLWGFLVANFIFLLGITQFGVAFSAIMRICRAGWSRAYYRAAELITLAYLPIAYAGLLYIYFQGSPHLFYWLSEAHDAHRSPWLDNDLLLWRNLLAQTVFYLIAIAYFVMGLLPDISADDAANGPGWRRWIYRRLFTLRKSRDEESLKRNVYLWSPLVLVAAVIANTFIAWDFGMMLVEHYHSTVFPMYYIIGNMFSGAAALLFITVILRRIFALESLFQTVHVQSMAVLLTGFALLWMYFFWAQFFVSWYGNLDHEYGVLTRHFFGHYAPVFWIMMTCNFVIPVACLIFVAFKQSWRAMALLAVIINTGIWLNRYLIVVPALSDDHYPLTSLAEFSITAGLVAGFLLILSVFFNAFPVVSRWELQSAGDE